MTTALFVKKVFAVVFLFAIVGGAFASLALRHASLREGLAAMPVPESPADLAEAARSLERALSATVDGDARFVEAHGAVQRMLGKREVDAFALVKDENGFLNVGAMIPPDLSRLAVYASRVQWLKRLAARDGANVVFVSPPGRVLPGFSSYAPGLPYEDRNPLQDSFLFFLWQYRVDCLDARAVLAESGLPPEEWVFRTENRWTPPAAFATFRRLVSYMDATFGADLDPEGFYANRENYETPTIPGAFLGEWGRRTGAAFSGREDFTAVLPRFDGEFAVEWVDSSGVYGKAEGGFEDTLIDVSALRGGDARTFSPNDYSMSGLKRWARVVNLRHHDRPRLLLVHDASGAALIPLLAPMFGDMHAIWSTTGEYAASIDQYLSANRFDYVVVVLSPSSLTEEGMHFFTGARNQ